MVLEVKILFFINMYYSCDTTGCGIFLSQWPFVCLDHLKTIQIISLKNYPIGPGMGA